MSITTTRPTLGRAAEAGNASEDRRGAAVEIRETVQEIVVPTTSRSRQAGAGPKPSLFEHLADDELLSYGVPAEWLDDVRQANEDSLLELADHLPGEAAEALLELATGGQAASRSACWPRAVDPFDIPTRSAASA